MQDAHGCSRHDDGAIMPIRGSRMRDDFAGRRLLAFSFPRAAAIWLSAGILVVPSRCHQANYLSILPSCRKALLSRADLVLPRRGSRLKMLISPSFHWLAADHYCLARLSPPPRRLFRADDRRSTPSNLSPAQVRVERVFRHTFIKYTLNAQLST